MRKCSHTPTPGFKSCASCREKLRLKQRRRYKKHPIIKQKQLEINREWRNKTPWFLLWQSAKKRSKERNIPFTITLDHIKKLYNSMNGYCPVLKIPMNKEGELYNFPSLDRIIPTQGYVEGNVRIISYRANMLKSNSTLEEMRLIVSDLESFLTTE